jgi:hypothetical protein
MTEENPEEKGTEEKKYGEQPTLRSLLAEAKGIEPLIIGVFVIIIYCFMSGIAFFLSWKYGRI